MTTNKDKKTKIVVGMSGGVDSSVAAYLLKEQGYDVIGVTMQIWQDEEREIVEDQGGCCGLSAVDDARRVAQALDIPYYVMNFKEEFNEYVIDYFIKEYQAGRTPNPCIACNRYVKWESLLNKSLQLGASHIATGHYANIAIHPETGRYTLKTSVTAHKDQTYALYNLNQDQLAHTLMPVGQYTKDEIREIAEKIGLCIAHKPDSQEICFIPDHDHGRFIEEETKELAPRGHFVDQEGNILGEHQGLIRYTIGQRKGLGIALGKPMYVVALRPETNEVVLGESEDIFTTTLHATDLNFMMIEDLKEPMKVKGKIRYNQIPAPCTIRKIDEDRIECVFDEPQRAITPGQAVVFYDGEYVVGGGTIITL